MRHAQFNLGANLSQIKLEIVHVEKQHMAEIVELLQSLSEFKPSETEYDSIWEAFHKQEHVHSIVALLDKRVVGYGSIIIETKIRGGKMAHIEDIVSGTNYRNLGIGREIVNALHDIAIEHRCYKIALQCSQDNVPFYEKCGYQVSGLTLQRFL